MAITNTDLLHKWVDRNADALNEGEVREAWIEFHDGDQTDQIHINVLSIWERMAQVLHNDVLPWPEAVTAEVRFKCPHCDGDSADDGHTWVEVGEGEDILFCISTGRG